MISCTKSTFTTHRIRYKFIWSNGMETIHTETFELDKDCRCQRILGGGWKWSVHKPVHSTLHAEDAADMEPIMAAKGAKSCSEHAHCREAFISKISSNQRACCKPTGWLSLFIPGCQCVELESGSCLNEWTRQAKLAFGQILSPRQTTFKNTTTAAYMCKYQETILTVIRGMFFFPW